MPVIVKFGCDDHLPGGLTQTCGPYRTVQIVDDVLWAADGFSPVRLARRTPTGEWEVNGLDGLLFKSVLIMPPLKQARKDLDRAAEDYDDEQELDG